MQIIPATDSIAPKFLTEINGTLFGNFVKSLNGLMHKMCFAHPLHRVEEKKYLSRESSAGLRLIGDYQNGAGYL